MVLMMIVLIAMLGVAVVTHHLSQKTKTSPSKTIHVLVASKALKAGAFASKDDVQVKSLRVADDMLLNMPNVIVLKTPEDKHRYNDKRLYRDKDKGALLTHEDLMGNAVESMPLGMRGYTFYPSTLKGWNHNMKPDDYVNLYWVGTPTHPEAEAKGKISVIFLQHLHVVSVRPTKQGDALESVTLSLTDEEIEAILALPGGQLHMSLRPFQDKAMSAVVKTSSKSALQNIELIQELRIKRRRTGCRYPSNKKKLAAESGLIIETSNLR